MVDLVLHEPSGKPCSLGDIGIGGQNPRYTTYLVDGGQNTDLYYGGLVARFGLQRSISPEAVAEVQVLAAPADVRNGDFAGGAVNIVTRSGTNEWHGSAFGFFQSDALVGTDAADAPPPGNFSTPQFGVTLSGPLVKNRLQFFLNADLQRSIAPDDGPFVTDATGSAADRIGIPYQSIARFDSILTHTYGLETGGTGRSDYPPTRERSVRQAQCPGRSQQQLELSDHYARTTAHSGPGRGPGCYSLGSMASEDNVTANALRLAWRGLFGRGWSNEMSLGYLWTQEENPSTERALIDVSGRRRNLQASPWNAGGYRFVLGTNTVEFTDNVTVGLGSHVVTFGTHDELLQFQDNVFPLSGGFWGFGSLDSLARRDSPTTMTRGCPAHWRPRALR